MGLGDSPVGLAAWMLEKFQAWSDCDTVPEGAIALDDLITNIMIYWVTDTAQSAARFYAGSRERPFHLVPGHKITPPCGVVTLPRELPMPPRSWAERAFTHRALDDPAEGRPLRRVGEQPELLAEDIRAFFSAAPEGRHHLTAVQARAAFSLPSGVMTITLEARPIRHLRPHGLRLVRRADRGEPHDSPPRRADWLRSGALIRPQARPHRVVEHPGGVV